jgi:hypothetical protein
VEPGKHFIKAIKSGYWLNQTDVELAAGEQKDLSIAMQERVHSQHIAYATPVNVQMKLQGGISQEAAPMWPRNLMIASGVGMAVGVGALATGLIISDKATGAKAETSQGVAIAGGLVSALSLGGLIIGLASIASRPAPQPVINIQPTLTQDAKGAGGGVAVSGTW